MERRGEGREIWGYAKKGVFGRRTVVVDPANGLGGWVAGVFGTREGWVGIESCMDG